VAERERLVVAARVGPQPRRCGGVRSGPAAETVIDEVLLHGRRADLVAAFREPIGVLAATRCRLDHGQGPQVFHDVGRGGVRKLRRSAGLGINASSPYSATI
jgi:hypothetical protein